MATRKKNRVSPPGKSSDVLSKLGINIPDLNDFNENEGSDDDLECELDDLLSGKSTTRQSKVKQDANIANLDRMIADCMRNPGDEDDDDEDVSDDEDLLAELHSLTNEKSSDKPINKNDRYQEPLIPMNTSSLLDVLNERFVLYKQAEAASKEIDDASKTRRYGRAIKTLETLISSAKAGMAINEDDIPPIVSLPKPSASAPNNVQETQVLQPGLISPTAVPLRPAPHIPQATEQSNKFATHQSSLESNILDSQSPERCLPNPLPPQPTIPSPQTAEQSDQAFSSDLELRRNQYKTAALNAKRHGDTETALKYLKIAKKFDVVIEAADKGQSVDLSDMPPPPPEYFGEKSFQPSEPTQPLHTKNEKLQNASNITDVEAAAMAAANEPADHNLFNAPEPPATILEALEQRLQKYCDTRDAAKNEGNASKARRLQRIVQQHEVAIKSHKAGKPVIFTDLPTPPGFAPIPVDNGPSNSASVTSKTLNKSEVSDKQPTFPPQPGKPVQSAASNSKNLNQPVNGKHLKVQRAGTLTILDKQLNYLLERQKLFRQAALESKKNGDIQQAKHYLCMSKGFNSMIEATEAGLPIDATTIPTPPQLESDFVIINETDCIENEFTEHGMDVFPRLVEELQHQVEMCTKNKEHFMRLGDVSSAFKFEKLCLDTKKYLVFVHHAWHDGEPVPRFHYETRLFSLVQCNTDLADDEIEIIVIRGINLPGKPDDLDTYTRVEFPIPQESPQRAKTHTVRDTNCPSYQESFKFSFNRKSRSQLRQFKRQSLKFEVWSKGKFFRNDFIIGTVIVKLVDLETKCCIHNSFDLLEGRKLCGGKLEVKLRIRDPLLAKQIEEVREKWLIIGS